MNLNKKIMMILSRPAQFFKTLNEKGLVSAFKYFALFYFIFTILTLVMSYWTRSVAYVILTQYAHFPVPAHTSFLARLVMTLVGYPISLLFSFVAVGILHIYLKIFGGKAHYENTYQLWAYASTPTYLFGWIPFVSVFASIWTFVLMIIGTSEVHKMSRLKAALLFIIPAVLVLILVGILIAIVMSLVGTKFT